MNKRLITFLFCLFFCTQMRTVITFLMPLSLFMTGYLFKIRVSTKVLFFYILIAISSFVGLLLGSIDFANSFLFCWLVMPLLLLQFGRINKSIPKIKCEDFIDSLVIVIGIVDFVGIICLIVFQTPDEYGRGYGAHFKGVSGLAVVNAMLSYYYLSKFLCKKYRRKDILLFLMLFVSTVLCFSALTLITYMITLLCYFLLYINLRRIISFIPFILLAGVLLVSSGLNIYEYNKRNLELMLDSDIWENNARKIMMYIKAVSLNEESPFLISICGCGPAGYNSRTCFLINEDSNNLFTDLLGHHMPYYHARDIYPLWNKSFVSVDAFTDGARNKPFSSLVSIWIELGLVFLITFCWLWIKNIREYGKKASADSDYIFLFLLNVFVFLLLFTEYWLESSEYLLFLILQGSVLNKKNAQGKRIVKIQNTLL